jgi:tRNA/tmRNA/rRNA uracil-C5-methylase (TrmA/RlmC/RlmD family)
LAIPISGGGDAVAHVEEGEGGGGGAAPNKRKKSWVFFCPNIIPGNLVRLRVCCNFVSYSDTNLLHVIEPSADCTKPACPLATVCGMGGEPVPAHYIQMAEEHEDLAGAGIVQATRGSVALQIPPPGP